jgi:hypothetical protein
MVGPPTFFEGKVLLSVCAEIPDSPPGRRGD